MASLESSIALQMDTYALIVKAGDNFAKLPADRRTTGRIKTRIEDLESNWRSFKSLHGAICNVRTPAVEANPYFQEDLYSSCEDKYLEIHGVMLDLLESLTTARTESGTRPTANLNQPHGSSRSRQLPKIELPKFNGVYTQWKTFSDLFTSLIGSDPDLTDVEKLHYLKSCLADEPEQLLKNIAVSNENYRTAWDTLVTRYENKRLIIDAHLASLASLKSPRRESAADLKSLIGNVTEALGALKALGCTAKDLWDYSLVFSIARKLDSDSVMDWENSLGDPTKLAKFAEMEKFILRRVQKLEAYDRSTGRKPLHTTQSSKSLSVKSHSVTPQGKRCSCCSADHYIASCTHYLAKPATQRREFVIAKKLCFNCLGPHAVKECRSAKRCRTCDQPHHTSLHGTRQTSISAPFASTSSQNPEPTGETSGTVTSGVSIHLAETSPVKQPPVILATAWIDLVSPQGRRTTARALIDQGSEVSFVSETLAQRLRLPRRAAAIPVIGIGACSSGSSNGTSLIRIMSRVYAKFELDVCVLILPKLTAYVPPTIEVGTAWSHLQGLPLADPHYNKSHAIEVILGAAVYARILEDGLIKGSMNAPIAQRTSLGWILSGASLSSCHNAVSPLSVHGLQCTPDYDILSTLQQFWALEEPPHSPTGHLTKEEQQCEDFFKATVSRDGSGKFIVRLPFKSAPRALGDSYSAAHRMLLRMEHRFENNQSFKSSYSEFIREYEALGHMTVASATQNHGFILPHHGVFKSTPTGSKIRVVFNGSQKSTSGFSLNDILHVGPKLQTELAHVLLRWRRHRFVFTTDIEKMYRQILVHADDVKYQEILWRDCTDGQIKAYLLLTVTYGLACAPYLAIKCIRHLASEIASEQPVISEILNHDMYVDDTLSGAETISATQLIVAKLSKALLAGGFPLKKWTSNHPAILEGIAKSDLADDRPLKFDDFPARALGLAWSPTSDHFSFSPPSEPSRAISLTKRVVLSRIASIFDPLGFIAPVTVRAKIFLQELWALGLPWDDALPDQLAVRWQIFVTELDNLSAISVPRWIGLIPESTLEIHGFADASQVAMGAAIYVRVTNLTGKISTSLLCAKTKVAPLKKLTIPRLELCAALLLVRLVTSIRSELRFGKVPCHLWTDSSVALHWIRDHPSRWKEFVRNRVVEIQELPFSQWHHVPTHENPADLASRGISPLRLSTDTLWWIGPAWLSQSSERWPNAFVTPPTSLTGEESAKCVLLTTTTTSEDSILSRFSTLTRLLRVTAWCRRVLPRTRSPHLERSSYGLSAWELHEALLIWVRKTQAQHFSEEMKALISSKPLAKSSSLRALAPFKDEFGLLRLGGRLQFSALSRDEMHPLILPKQSLFTQLVVRHHHLQQLHSGTQSTLASIRRRFWIISGRQVVKSAIYQCVRCERHRAATSSQRMGSLPLARVTSCKPFLHTGVDYAGPFTLRTVRGRGGKTYKGYLVLFICFSTSAIHLDMVTDYSTAGFIAALRRFIGRRGICSTLYSDCGTNFIGANRELRQLFASSGPHLEELSAFLSLQGITWKFNPPATPHFGGKWEAGVKSVKHHLRRVIGEVSLTYEDYVTVLTQIEAVLNSRPLCATSDDPEDTAALTPGHFLTSAALTAIPEPSLQDVPLSRLARWQLLQRLTDDFWRRWFREYLHHLQTLPKWRDARQNLRIGNLVLIKEDRLPPTQWALARITDVHPGKDGLARVATLGTATSTLRRPIVKLCVLPVA